MLSSAETTNLIPPQSQESEQAVLGSMLLERDAVVTAVHALTPDDFYFHKHQLIFEGMQACFEEHRFVETKALAQWLQDHGNLEEIGGTLYLFTLQTQVTTAAACEHHCKVVLEKSRRRLMIHACHDLINRAYTTDAENIEEIITGAYQVLDALTPPPAENIAVSAFDATCQYLARTKEFVEEQFSAGDDKREPGIPHYSQAVNEILKPAQRSQLIVLAGDTGMGKTAQALQWAYHAAQCGYAVDYYTLEMDHEELGERLIAAVSPTPPNDLRMMIGHPESRQEMLGLIDFTTRHYRGLPLTIISPSRLTPTDVVKITRKRRLHQRVDMIFIDYLGLMDTDTPSRTEIERMQKLGDAAKKVIANQLRVPVVMLAQFNDAMSKRGNRRPHLSDIAYAKNMVKHSNATVFLYRPGYYFREDGDWRENKSAGFADGDEATTEIIIAKQRRGGIGNVKNYYVPERTWFYETEQQAREAVYSTW